MPVKLYIKDYAKKAALENLKN